MPRPLIADMERVFHVPFIEAYGMTEAAPQIASNRLSPRDTETGFGGAGRRARTSRSWTTRGICCRRDETAKS